MFLPMSWTSPFTVAITILPALLCRLPPPRSAFSFSMYGSRWATACFITRADLTTCGRNILPEPNRSPTTFMPSISGPSMTWSGRSAASRASSVSSVMNSVMPWTSACESRFSTGQPRHSTSTSFASLPLPAKRLAIASRRSAASGRRLSTTSSQASRSSGIEIVVHRHLAGIDDAHVHAGLDGVIEEHRVHRLAHPFVATERERKVRHAA